MIGLKDLSGLLAGTLCPKMKLMPQTAAGRHAEAKKKAFSNLKKYLTDKGQRLVATAGINTGEATVTLELRGHIYKGRPDLIILTELQNHYNLVVVEAKSSIKSARSVQAVIQASLYATPAYLCTRYPQECTISISGRGIVHMIINASRNGLRAALEAILDSRDVDLSILLEKKISSFQVFVASPERIEDVTEDTVNIIGDIIESLLAAPLHYRISKNNIVPGPWCKYCEHFHRGTCTAGLILVRSGDREVVRDDNSRR